jgi:hypothetical protein
MAKIDEPISSRVFVHFGALCEPIATQVKQQGLTIEPEDASMLQYQANALVTLKIAGLVTEAECHRIQIRILKMIIKKCRKSVES